MFTEHTELDAARARRRAGANAATLTPEAIRQREVVKHLEATGQTISPHMRLTAGFTEAALTDRERTESAGN
ncbi:hypothetical protein ICL81_04540 [Leucobacter sp. cx-328]|uniref:hypothetical protein n=1 Tax=unclassified Leucobacter TaxID=2621730 RepID=UPI00165E3468|nr:MULTISPECIES: hypothetical protein [unclassified Leucobacter]MBC9943794.1 hypothetical protein [Leucobacter sp. cx-328]